MRGVIDTVDSLITGPQIEPLDIDEVKKSLRFGSSSEDTLIDVYISMARQHFEEQTGRQLITATWEHWLDAVPITGEIELPHPPLQSVLSVKYDDSDSVEQTFDAADYRVIAPAGPFCGPGRVVLASGSSWPSALGQSKAVRIRYLAGYGSTPGDVPELCKGALYFLVGHFHKYRAEVQDGPMAKLPMGAEAILRAFRYASLSTLAPLSTVAWP